jgi:hypothetical protein
MIYCIPELHLPVTCSWASLLKAWVWQARLKLSSIIKIQNMLSCPSPPANLVNMSIRVVSLAFELCALYYRSPQPMYSNFASPLKRWVKRGGGGDLPVYRVQCRLMNLFYLLETGRILVQSCDNNNDNKCWWRKVYQLYLWVYVLNGKSLKTWSAGGGGGEGRGRRILDTYLLKIYYVQYILKIHMNDILGPIFDLLQKINGCQNDFFLNSFKIGWYSNILIFKVLKKSRDILALVKSWNRLKTL